MTMVKNIRKANAGDIDRVVEIYRLVHDAEKNGLLQIGWDPDIYPIAETAICALERGDLFVYEIDGYVVASAIINNLQDECYRSGNWNVEVNDNEVMVLHTLTVDPSEVGKGIGRDFVAFYEKYACLNDCRSLRLDTHTVNIKARRLYPRLGYKEVGTVITDFHGLRSVNLVLLEKEV